MGVSVRDGTRIFPGGANNTIRLLAGERGAAAGDKQCVRFVRRFLAGTDQAPALNRLALIKTQWMNRRKTIL